MQPWNKNIKNKRIHSIPIEIKKGTALTLRISNDQNPVIVLVQWSIFPFYRTALYFSTKPISTNATATEHIKQTHTHTHTHLIVS